MTRAIRLAILCAALALGAGCAPLNHGVPGSPAVTHPAIDGTVFTIVFENKNQADMITPSLPNFYRLATEHGSADAYINDGVHPSLPNYIHMTSGSTHGITTDNPPATNITIPGNENLADQLDAAGVSWRAYMDAMGEPCRMESAGTYEVEHAPFLYYTSLTSDPARCAEHVVDLAAHFDADLAADTYRYMWITPDNCNDTHNCTLATGDAWLGDIVARIMASPGYLRGGVIFILTDEGYLRLGGAAADLAAIVVSPRLVHAGYATDTRFDHSSYLATVEDIFGMPRLPTTVSATPMGEFFQQRATP